MSPRVGLDYQSIVTTAIQLADKEGINGVTIATVAKELGVRPPSLYNHISGLQELRNKVALYGLQELLKRMKQATYSLTKEKAIHELAKSYLTFAREHPGVYELTTSSPDPLEKDIQKESEAIVNLTVSILTTFDLNEEECVHAVRGIRSLLHGFASLEKNGGFGLPLSLDDSFTKMLNAYIAGLSLYKT